MAYASEVITADKADIENAVRVVTDAATVLLPMGDLVNFAEEVARLEAELEKAEKDKGYYQNKLSNPNFVAKAPEKLVEEQRTLMKKAEDRIAALNSSIDEFKKMM